MLAADGLEASEIAARFGTTPGTVKTQRERLRRKLKARNMAHAIALAYAAGLIEPAAPAVPRTSDYAGPEPEPTLTP